MQPRRAAGPDRGRARARSTAGPPRPSARLRAGQTVDARRCPSRRPRSAARGHPAQRRPRGRAAPGRGQAGGPRRPSRRGPRRRARWSTRCCTTSTTSPAWAECSRPGIVHRLDRGTSGLMVVAKDDATHRALGAAVRRRARWRRSTWRWSSACPRRAQGDDRRAHRTRPRAPPEDVGPGAARARGALARYAVAEALDGAALLRVRIHTGRTHQIRVHLASHRPSRGGRRDLRRPPRASRRRRRAARPCARSSGPPCTPPGWPSPSRAPAQRLAFESPLPADLADVLVRLRG